MVGDSSEYCDWEIDWDKLKHLQKGQLLAALAGSKLFRRKLLAVDLSDCSVAVLKGALPAGRTVPIAADEAAHKFAKLGGPLTLSDVTTDGACTGNQLFIRVHLPGAAGAVHAPTPGAALAGEEGSDVFMFEGMCVMRGRA
jgi:hypothetical protein